MTFSLPESILGERERERESITEYGMTEFFDGIVNGLEAKVQKGPALDGLEAAKKTDLDQFPVSPLPSRCKLFCRCSAALLFLYP